MPRPFALAPLAFTPIALALLAGPAAASSHREAPAITASPKVDATDLYAFRSYESGRAGYVTILANYQPFQDPQGGPNFYMFDERALYEIHVDNDGDARPDLTFQFRFDNTSKGTALNVGGRMVKIPLVNSGPLAGTNPAALNVRETYTVQLVRRQGNGNGAERGALAKVQGGGTTFDKPADHIGEKTFSGAGGYAAYANAHLYEVTIPGCTNTGRVFVGQRKEPFYIAVGKVFDLINLNPLGAEVGGNRNDLEGKSVSTLALEVPIACLTAGSDPVIGVWTTASQRQSRVLDGNPGSGIGRAVRDDGGFVQVSRLGMPLVNEVLIGLDDKDRFNASPPRRDAERFADYFTHPTLPALIETLFPAAKAPTHFPRTDLIALFGFGLQGLNRPAGNPHPAEMLRLNTAIAPTAAAAQNPLGVAGGDNAGFPNGRRPADDVVDAALRVMMGALCTLSGNGDALKVGCTPAHAPAGGLALTDGVRKTAADYGTAFPYLATPLPGNTND